MEMAPGSQRDAEKGGDPWSRQKCEPELDLSACEVSLCIPVADIEGKSTEPRLLAGLSAISL